MTTAISNPNTNSKLADLLNSSSKSNNNKIIQSKPQTTEQADSFEKKPQEQIKVIAYPQNKSNKKSTRTSALKSLGLGVCTCVIAALCIRKIEKASAMAQKGKEAINKFANLWEDLSNATKLEEMALPKELNDVFHKIIKCIENPKAIQERGGDGIKTILLYGPPGTGKTTFAKAIAKHFPNSRFASLDVTNLGSKYVGETEKNIQAAVNEICKQALANPDKKFFVFIDEIDSVIMVDDGNLKKHSNDILNEFKRCFTERLGKHNNIITIGATNVPINPDTGKTFDGKRLDKPMLDRFQEKILVDRPSWEQIRDALFNHYKDRPQVCDELHSKTSEKVNGLCKSLAQKEHEVSFRTLSSIFNDAATCTDDMNAKLSLQDIFNAIKAKQKDLHYTNEELENLAKNLGVTI